MEEYTIARLRFDIRSTKEREVNLATWKIPHVKCTNARDERSQIFYYWKAHYPSLLILSARSAHFTLVFSKKHAERHASSNI